MPFLSSFLSHILLLFVSLYFTSGNSYSADEEARKMGMNEDPMAEEVGKRMASKDHKNDVTVDR